MLRVPPVAALAKRWGARRLVRKPPLRRELDVA